MNSYPSAVAHTENWISHRTGSDVAVSNISPTLFSRQDRPEIDSGILRRRSIRLSIREDEER